MPRLKINEGFPEIHEKARVLTSSEAREYLRIDSIWENYAKKESILDEIKKISPILIESNLDSQLGSNEEDAASDRHRSAEDNIKKMMRGQVITTKYNNFVYTIGKARPLLLLFLSLSLLLLLLFAIISCS